MKQHLLTLFLALAASVAPLFAQSGTCGTNLTWTLDTESGILTISGTGAMTNYTYSSNAPWYSYRASIKTVKIGSSVTSIGNYAFYYCYMTSITIPNSVTSIGNSAFYGCSSLTSIEIPNSVTSIGEYAFSDCSSLTSINVTESNKNLCSIDGVLFNKSKTTLVRYPQGKNDATYSIPNSVTNISGRAFERCGSLTSIVIPNSVTSIEEYAFSGCCHLTSFEIPNSLTLVDDRALDRECFYYDENSRIIEINFIGTIEDWIERTWDIDGPYVLYINKSLVSKAVFTNNTTRIYERAFSGCISLTSVEIPNSVTSIEYDAFKGCSGLTSIEIPNSVTSIEYGAFYGCSSLTSIVIPNSVTSIGNYAFYGCSSLTSIVIPNSVTSIGGYAFSGCRSLTSVEIPNSVTSIGGYAFSGCSSLTSIEIPNSVTSIGGYAFSGCSSLTSIEIPNSVTGIQNFAFSLVPNVIYSGSEEGAPWGARSLNGYVEGYLVYNDYTKTNLLACSGAAVGKVSVPNSVTNIETYAFYNCNHLTSLEIPNSVTSIGEFAFEHCSSLTSIEIPNSVTSIGESAFFDCNGLYFIKLGSGIKEIGLFAFDIDPCELGFDSPKRRTSGTSDKSASNLLSITCNAVIPPSCDIDEHYYNPFTCFDLSIPLYVPAKSVDAYKRTTVWQYFKNILPICETCVTIIWQNADGAVLEIDENVPYGTTPEYNGETPTNSADGLYSYTFIGWSDGTQTYGVGVELPAVTGNATYTAVFESVVQCGTIETTDGITVWDDQLPYTWEGISFTTAGTETKTLQASDGCDSIVTFTLRVLYRNITLQENEAADFYTQFATDYNGRTVTTATLNRQFTQGKWATLCLPFDVNKALMTSLGLYNRVFELRYAEKLDDETIQMYFAPAQTLEAGKGYIVNANTKLAQKTSFVFPNVTINTDADNGDITALTGYNDGTNRGNLYLVGTLRTGILQGTTSGNTYLGLKDNQLYYPNSTSGTPMRAYRAVFRCDIPVNASRVRIIAEGEPVSELEVTVDEQGRMDNGQLQNNATPARKYLRNGLLFIERNGITYTAQGQRID